MNVLRRDLKDTLLVTIDVLVVVADIATVDVVEGEIVAVDVADSVLVGTGPAVKYF